MKRDHFLFLQSNQIPKLLFPNQIKYPLHNIIINIKHITQHNKHETQVFGCTNKSSLFIQKEFSKEKHFHKDKLKNISPHD